jgi:hypothetical protein
MSCTRLAGAGQPGNDQEPGKDSWSSTLQRVVIILAEQGPGVLLAIAYLVGHH